MTDNQENKENLVTNTESNENKTVPTKKTQPEDVKKEVENPARKSVSVIRQKSSKSTHATHALGQATSRLKMRKLSIGISSVMSIRINELASSMALEYKRPFIVFEPTYRLEPITRFDSYQVEIFINKVLDSTFEGHKYNVDATPELAVKLANTIMREVKHMLFDRYRIITIVAIGQKRAQSYNNTISFIWDPLTKGCLYGRTKGEYFLLHTDRSIWHLS